MIKTILGSHLKRVAIYVFLCLFVAVSACIFLLRSEFILPDIVTLLLGVASLLLVWHFSFQFPYLGMVSMERLPQFHMLLTLSISESVIINAIAAMIMPFINKSYRMNSYPIAILRAANNTAMNIFILLSAYYAMKYFIEFPVSELNMKIGLVLLFAAVVSQIINVLQMLGYIHFYNKKGYKLIMNPQMMFMDLVFVPVGVLSALLYQLPDKSIFALFCFFIVLMLFSLNSLMPKKSADKKEFSSVGTDYKSDSLDTSSICKAIVRRAEQLFDMDCVYILFKNQKEKKYQVLYKYETLKLGNPIKSVIREVVHSEDIITGTKTINRNGKEIKVNIMSAPFHNQEGFFSYLLIVRDENREFIKPDISLGKLLTNRYELALSYAIGYKELTQYKETLEQKVIARTRQLEEANHQKSLLVKKLEDLSNTDSLTGLYNRRYFDNKLSELKSDPPESMALAILDIDHFKKINDVLGHEAGDQVLRMASEFIRSKCSDDMLFFRYGGEEFVVLSNNPDIEVLTETCKRIVEEFPHHKWSIIDQGLKVTISIGLAVYPQAGWDDLFSKADSMLYKAKNNGRNQLQY